MSKLALFGGKKSVKVNNQDIFHWPIVTPDHEKAVLEVLYKGEMSGLETSRKFEENFARKVGRNFGLMCNNGTAAIHCGFYGLGVGIGDEVICPSVTYWASVLQVYSLGATPVFADINPETLCLDPDDFESLISERTKALVVVHYAGYPAEIDKIMAIAQKYNIKVLEDCSHAHFALYHDRQIGTFGDVAGYSLMTGKSFAIGEAGIMLTDDCEIMERAIHFGHYGRHAELEKPKLAANAGLPAGGYKYRSHQLSSAFGLTQLDYVDSQFEEIDAVMSYFCDQIDKLPGLRSHRPDNNNGCTKGGWYFPLAHYNSEELDGLSNNRFCEAVKMEGSQAFPGCNKPLHTHSIFNTYDVYGHGKSTRIANLPDGIKIDQIQKPLNVSETINDRIIGLPWFKLFNRDLVDSHIAAFQKVAENHKELLLGDDYKHAEGEYSSTFRKK